MATRSRKSALTFILKLLIACLIVGLGTTYLVAGALVAPRPNQIGAPPEALGAETLTLHRPKGHPLKGWHIPAAEARGLVLLFHGMGADRRVMLPRVKFLKDLGLSSLAMDLQAHGESEGPFIGMGAKEKEDIRLTLRHAKREYPHLPIALIGISLGGAASLLAGPLGLDAMILEGVYPTINEAVYNRVRVFLGPMAWLPSQLLLWQLKPRLGINPSNLRPIDNIAAVDCPLFIISGQEDAHTLATETQRLYDAAPQPKALWLLPGAGHVDLMAHDPIEYQRRVGAFLRQYL